MKKNHRNGAKEIAKKNGKSSISEERKIILKKWIWYALWCSWVGHKIKGCEPCSRCGEILPIGGKKNH